LRIISYSHIGVGRKYRVRPKIEIDIKLRFGETSEALPCWNDIMNTIQDPNQVPGSNPDPASPHHAPIKTTTEARGGVAFGHMRWVLGISLTAVVMAFLVIWAIGR
jgi:hypothetical protein